MSKINTKWIADSAVTVAKLAPLAANTILGNNTGSAATPSALSVSQVQSLLSVPTSGSPLSVAAGGTGLSSLTANAVILGNGTSSPTFVAPGASGNVLTSNGTTWVSSAAAASGANTALSNLSSVAINTALLPATDFTGGAINLGSNALRFATLYASTAQDASNVNVIGLQTRILYSSTGATVANWSSGALAMNSNKITGLANGTAAGDALSYSQLGVANGIATLDSGGKIPVAQLPSAVMTYEGTWNASTNTPTLADGTGDPGQVYVVSVAGTQNLGSGSQTFAVGDWVVANASIVWQKVVNSNAVASVNGQTGAVTVNAINQLTGDVTAGPASGSASAAATIATGAVTLAKMASNSVDESKIVSTTMSSTGALDGGNGTKLAVRSDAVTVKVNGSNNLEALKQVVYAYTITATDITNQYVDLVTGNGLPSSAPAYGTSALSNSVSIQPVGAPMQSKGVDFTVALTGGAGGSTRISFAGDLAANLVAGDIVNIQYSYL
jgi:hypothetical protein